MTKADGHFDVDWVGKLPDDEHIQWQGQPYGGLLPLTISGFLAVFGWLTLAFSLATFSYAWPYYRDAKTLDAALALLFAVGFVALGTYFTLWPHAVDCFLRRHTQYALSNFRAFIGGQAFGQRWLKTYPINPFTPLEIDEFYAGGTVWFEKILFEVDGESADPTLPSYLNEGAVRQRIGFVGIPDYLDVYDRLRQMQVFRP